MAAIILLVWQHMQGVMGFLIASLLQSYFAVNFSWWRGTVVERRSLSGELSLSCARPAADG